jgi:hypothetical protein
MLVAADFDQVYAIKTPNVPEFSYTPTCNPPACFVGSYAPVTPAGQEGPFWTNTYFLRPDRNMEVAGPVPIRSKKLGC